MVENGGDCYHFEIHLYGLRLLNENSNWFSFVFAITNKLFTINTMTIDYNKIEIDRVSNI